MRGIVGCIAVLLISVAARAGGVDTGDTALWMLVQALHPADGGGDASVARALRHLRDPGLRPAWVWLSESGSVVMRRHGLLGVAEVSDPATIRLDRLATVSTPAELAEVVSAALDGGLLAEADARVMLEWPGLDVAVKELIALGLLERGRTLGDLSWLRDALRHTDGGRAALAALLLHECGEPAGTEALMRLLDDDADNAEQVRAMVLQTAVARRFSGVSGWAFLVAAGEGSAGLRELALRVALELGDPRAVTLWQERWEAATGVSERARWALLALRAAPATPDAVFETAAAGDDPFIRQIASAGLAAGRESADAAEQVAALLRFDHPVTDAWALQYARRDAPPRIAGTVLRAFITGYTPGRVESRARRLDMVMQAAQALADDHPQMASGVIEPLLSAPTRDVELLDAVMLGLVRSGSETAAGLAVRLSEAAPASTRMLRALVVSGEPGSVTPGVRSDLALAVRGGGPLDASLRAQAAWRYLRAVGRGDELAAALSRPR